MYYLDGKVALVTGASCRRGLGCGIALGLAQEGADVIVTDKYRALDPWDAEEGWCGLDSVVAEIQALGHRGLAIITDLTDSRQITDLVEKALQEFGKIDILVNNAAIVSRDTGTPDVVDFPEKMWNETIAVNLTAPFLLCKLVVPQMVKRGEGGRIINILSTTAKRGARGRADYCASKFGLNGLTQVLARELGPHKITANGVCPGFVVTWGSRGAAIWKAMRQEGLGEEAAIKKVYAGLYGGRGGPPLGRPATRDDVVDVVLWLASSHADYITGQAVNVDGGATSH